MKKTPKKLVLRSETLRALVDMDLALAVAGFDSAAVPLVDSGKINCDTDAAVTATTTCPPR